MSRPEEVEALRERFAEVRGEHGWARYVEDDVLAEWLRPAQLRPAQLRPGPPRGEPEEPVSS